MKPNPTHNNSIAASSLTAVGSASIIAPSIPDTGNNLAVNVRPNPNCVVTSPAAFANSVNVSSACDHAISVATSTGSAGLLSAAEGTRAFEFFRAACYGSNRQISHTMPKTFEDLHREMSITVVVPGADMALIRSIARTLEHALGEASDNTSEHAIVRPGQDASQPCPDTNAGGWMLAIARDETTRFTLQPDVKPPAIEVATKAFTSAEPADPVPDPLG